MFFIAVAHVCRCLFQMSIVSAHGANAGVIGLFLPEDNAEKSSLYIDRSAFTACFPLKTPWKEPKIYLQAQFKVQKLALQTNAAKYFFFLHLQTSCTLWLDYLRKK